MDLPSSRELKWLAMCIDGAKQFPTCSRRQYYAIIIDGHGHVLATGYNGSPSKFPHCTDGGCPRGLTNDPPGGSYSDCVAVHAEANALLHSDYTARRDGGTLFVNGRPCWDCAKLVANSGIKRIVCVDEEPKRDYPKVDHFLEEAGVSLVCVGLDEL